MNGQQNKVEQFRAIHDSRVTKLETMDITFLTMESLILAQDERWRRASYMQVEREAYFGEWKVADG